MSKRIYIIAGEASGDLHGGNLVRELFKLSGGPLEQPATSPLLIRAWGGDRMAAAGAEVVKHYRDLAFIGYTQVIMNLRTILRNMELCKQDILAFKPDALILIDYPGFNLRIAEWAHGKGIPVHYYISPQLWAWKKGRVHTIKRVVDRLYAILPFEQAWYARYGVKVDFVGHPLLDAIEQEGKTPLAPLPGDDGRPVVALLPGSRKQEVERILPVMVQVAKRFPAYRFVLAAAPSIPESMYAKALADGNITLVSGRTYDVLRASRAALVKSGTATLETALLGVPEVVCYKSSALNVWLAKRLVNVKYVSLANLIMDREVVRELIQGDMTVESMSTELEAILVDGPRRTAMLNDLAALQLKLGGPGASAKVASSVWISLTTPAVAR
ncbi:MAG TPA: lipid-A-disaccharide synthase [Flavobacteriales bacterium]|nr:lipid-A-disaccharide synthase [Flavobacteriales bacterium]